jgi:hypothetical protein
MLKPEQGRNPASRSDEQSMALREPVSMKARGVIIFNCARMLTTTLSLQNGFRQC